ncbi:Thymidylate synthase ThyX [compost metagenome]
MPHIIVPEAEALLDKPIPVLDKGEVVLIDYMGSDSRVVAAARVSYGAGTKTLREDRGLIHYLMRNLHTSPFEQVILTFRIKWPLFVAAQGARHRTARPNAESFRYSEVTDEFYLPSRLRNQHATNMQGSLDAPFEPTEGCTFSEEELCGILGQATRDAFARYETLRRAGVARELSRIVIPQNLYTNWYWQIDLHNLFHFLRLRLDWHAQWEIRQYAEAMARCARAVAPLCYEAFEEHLLYGVRLSRTELEALRQLLAQECVEPARKLETAAAAVGLKARAIAEFSAKLLPEVAS